MESLSNSIFFNVSSNDVKLDGKTLDSKGAWQAFKKYKEEQKRVSLPEITPFLEEFENLEKVYLIVTAVEEAEENNDRASLNHGLLIKRIIEETYGNSFQVAIWELGISYNIKKIYDFYSERLAELEPTGRNIFSLSRETPIMDTALFVQASTIFHNVELYQRETKSGRFTALPHRETVRKLLTKQSIGTLIDQTEYGAAKNLLESEKIQGGT